MEKSWYEKYAEKVGVLIDKPYAPIILSGLEKNKQAFGQRYCPCKLQRVTDNICPCKEMRETKHCHCGLFVNNESNNTKK